MGKRMEENKQYAFDKYNLALGNIRALPYSISKTSALTLNNKIFPFVELYECTDVEKTAYYNKIRYDGMTVGIIDVIDNYVSEDHTNYFKGQLIRNTSALIDNHVLEDLKSELYKGVYI